jgi:3-deoxy-D-manno-octulosonic-acid transferase
VLLSLYHLAWTLIAIPLLPFAALFRHHRLHQRLALSHLPRPSREKSIWIHALSVGEVNSALPLVQALKQAYPSKAIVFTVTTSQGIDIARKELQTEVKALLPMPLDFWWSVDRLSRVIMPELFILVETDLWPGLMHRLKQRGIHTLLVNGRISPRTFRSYKRCPSMVRMMYQHLDLCFMQTDVDTERLLRIGVPPHKVKTIGNIKFDRDWPTMSRDEYDLWLRELHLSGEDPLWVAGSTHQGEEAILLDVFQKLLPLFPRLRLIIAPRRLEEAAEIHRLAQGKGLKPVFKTDLPGTDASYGVLILNTLGELGRVYGIAAISFVGGSLVPQGGHNPLEPASFGCPVLFGPHTQDFHLMSELLIEAGGGKRVRDGEELLTVMKELLSDWEKVEQMGKRAKAFVEMNKGSLARIMDHLRAYLGEESLFRSPV